MMTTPPNNKAPYCANRNSKSKLLQSVQHHYASYIAGGTTNGDEAAAVIQGNSEGLEGLGYADPAFLARCGLDTTVDRELLDAILEPSCGSGCPLRLLLTDNHSDDDAIVVKEDAVVVDLGCGTGHDVILASGMLLNKSGGNINGCAPKGRVIGVDVTEEMLAVAEKNVAAFCQAKGGGGTKSIPNMELIHDAFDVPIAHMEVAGLLSKNMADLVISNGVFNLTRDKKAAFATAHWLLKPGGTLLLADVCRVPDAKPGPDAFFSPLSIPNNNESSSWSA